MRIRFEIRVAITEGEQADAGRYCRADGIYLPR